MVYVGPVAFDVKTFANDIAKPTWKGPPGIQFKKYSVSKTQDELEYVELPLMDTLIREFPYQYVLGGASRDQKYHYWVKTLKSGGKEAMMVVGLPMQTVLPIDKKKEQAEEYECEKTIGSFKLA